MSIIKTIKMSIIRAAGLLSFCKSIPYLLTTSLFLPNPSPSPPLSSLSHPPLCLCLCLSHSPTHLSFSPSPSLFWRFHKLQCIRKIKAIIAVFFNYFTVLHLMQKNRPGDFKYLQVPGRVTLKLHSHSCFNPISFYTSRWLYKNPRALTKQKNDNYAIESEKWVEGSNYLQTSLKT